MLYRSFAILSTICGDDFLTSEPRRLILKSNTEFRQRFQKLKKGDVVSCILNLAPGEDYVLLDLMERGVIVFPPAISQLASRSKCCQALLFLNWMHPLTSVVRKKADLASAVEKYSKNGIGEVVTKIDRSDCGLGVCRWRSAEDLFNHVVFSSAPPYPFVLQPFIPDCTDIRIVWIGDKHREAYWRKNPGGFRNNLHFGGLSGKYQLSHEEESICRGVMERGHFPYAHVDLLRTEAGECLFSEISLFGGLKGAAIDVRQCAAEKEAVEKDFLQDLQTTFNGSAE